MNGLIMTMNHNDFNKCKCPSCKSNGRSVAAMNYEETKIWDRSGTFSGSGIGAGTAGIGIGLGGGIYSEQGQQQTKRAEVFKEPTRFKKPFISILIIGVAAMAFYLAAPSLMEEMGEIFSTRSESINQMSNLQLNMKNSLDAMLKILSPVLAIIIAFLFINKALINKEEENRLNTYVLPKKIDRYNQLRYCEKCNILYDPQGRFEVGSEIGFDRIMNYPY